MLDKLVTQLVSYLQLQIDSGVQAVQLFDTWVGALSVADFNEYVMPHLKRMISELKSSPSSVPVIYFGTGNGHLLEATTAADPDVLALDWRAPLVQTWQQLGVIVRAPRLPRRR